MFRRSISSGWVGLVLAGTMVCALAEGPFVEPADGPVPFRRDRLPLDAWMMRDLANKLVMLVEALDDKEAANRRAQAQMLALSLAVEPGYSPSKELMRKLRKDEFEVVDPKRTKWVPDRLRELVAWLDQEDAGRDGMALAACLKDVIRHAEGGPIEDVKEFGAWKSWVPELDAYKKKDVEVVKHTDPPDPVPNPSENNPSNPRTGSEGPKLPQKFQFTLKEASVQTPMWQMKGNRSSEGWGLESCALQVTATYQPDAEWQPFALRIGPPDSPTPLYALQERLAQVMAREHRSLPQGLVLHVNSREFTESLNSDQDHSISAVVGVLGSAIMTGRKPSAMVIGTVDNGGRFGPGSNFWAKLRSLNKDQAPRLVVSKHAEEYLDGLLTLRDLEFFFAHEVLFASDYHELLDRALEGGSPGVLSASEKFKVIQQRSKGENLPRYVANSYVRKRLEEVLVDDPNHASAKMLLKMANNQRSNSVTKRVMAAEMLRLLGPAFQVASVPHNEITWQNAPLPDLRIMDKKIQDELSDFQLYMDREDREWVDRAKEVADQIKALDRVLNMKSGDRAAGIYDACSRLAGISDGMSERLKGMVE